MSKHYTFINFPNPLLKQICKQVIFPLNEQTQNNIKCLKWAFRDSFMLKGVKTLGLAAPQIGVLQRFFLMPSSLNIQHIPLHQLKSAVRNFNVYINPKIISYSKTEVMIPQNCLSLGHDVYLVVRSQNVKVNYFNYKGQQVNEELSGIKARVFLHQFDHLNGITMEQRGTLQTQQPIMHQTKPKIEQQFTKNKRQTF